MNVLLKLNQHGQSHWLDNLERALRSGKLSLRVEHDGLRGVTSNPKTFHDAILKSFDYDEQIDAGARAGLSAQRIYEDLITTDVQRACDVLWRVYDTSIMEDGYVSLELAPRLAYDHSDGVHPGPSRRELRPWLFWICRRSTVASLA
jgi:transaldolase